ncbi:MAG: metalloregulator ArsR/SmtB family transcription factor [Syntrophales bacterium]|nr:metalloregulator ArsR/SmtB family transcription factor [Syntrophales bacterium]
MINLTEFLKALSDETRLRIMVLLSQKEMCVCEICEVLDESQPKVSRHLAKLRDAGLVRDNRQGQWVFYYVNLENKTASEILNIIISNIDEHIVLKNDRNKLVEKISKGTMCSREG